MLGIRSFFVAVAFSGTTFLSSADAQIQLDRFYPPAVGGSEATTIKAEGKFPQWPCRIRCDRRDVELRAAEEAGQITVTIADGAPPGVAWVRMMDRDSVSSLVPLLIQRDAVIVEPAKSTGDVSVDLPAVIGGRLASGGEVDSYAVSLQAGETFVATVIANQLLQSPMDAVLQLVDRRGNVLAQKDDDRGLDPQIVYRAENDTEAVVRIFAFPSQPNSTVGFAGGNSFVYAIEMTTGPMLDHVVPILTGEETEFASAGGWNLGNEPTLRSHDRGEYSPLAWFLEDGLGWYVQSSIDEKAITVAESDASVTGLKAQSLPVVLGGRIDDPNEVDRFRFVVAAGTKYRARSKSRSKGFLTDPVLRIVDTGTGDEIAREDDNSRVDFEAELDFTAKVDAEYELQISDAVEGSGMRHVYAVFLTELKPSVGLSVASDRFHVVAGEAVEIPIAISRNAGYAKELKLKVERLPEGVSATEVVSESKGDSAKSVKLKLTAGEQATFQDTIRIIAQELDGEKQPAGATHTAVFKVRDSFDLRDHWLTIAPKK